MNFIKIMVFSLLVYAHGIVGSEPRKFKPIGIKTIAIHTLPIIPENEIVRIPVPEETYTQLQKLNRENRPKQVRYVKLSQRYLDIMAAKNIEEKEDPARKYLECLSRVCKLAISLLDYCMATTNHND